MEIETPDVSLFKTPSNDFAPRREITIQCWATFTAITFTLFAVFFPLFYWTDFLDRDNLRGIINTDHWQSIRVFFLFAVCVYDRRS